MNEIPENITNRELGTMIQNNLEKNELQHEAIMTSLRSFHDKTEVCLAETEKTLNRILDQTTKTNGSVRGLLLWRANIQGKTFLVPILISAIVAGIIAFIVNHFSL